MLSIYLQMRPTGNLDKDNSQNIIDIFKKLVKEQGKCVIAVTHSERLKNNVICVSPWRIKNETI